MFLKSICFVSIISLLCHIIYAVVLSHFLRFYILLDNPDTGHTFSSSRVCSQSIRVPALQKSSTYRDTVLMAILQLDQE